MIEKMMKYKWILLAIAIFLLYKYFKKEKFIARYSDADFTSERKPLIDSAKTRIIRGSGIYEDRKYSGQMQSMQDDRYYYVIDKNPPKTNNYTNKLCN